MTTPKDESARKLALCKSCENIRIIALPFMGNSMLQCKICKCVMNAKVKIDGAQCPINKF